MSVVIPAYDAERHLGRALQAALGQTRVPDEVVVVDDGSRDGTAALAESYRPRVRLVRHGRNRGLAAARNSGLRAASGDVVALLDADDLWYPHKLERQLASFESAPPAVAVSFCFARVVALDGRSWIDCPDEPSPDAQPDRFLEALLVKNAVSGSGCSPLVRRQALLQVGGWDEMLRTCEDWDLWLRLAARWRFQRLDEVLCEGYARVGGLSLQLSRILDDARTVLARHLPTFLPDQAERDAARDRALRIIREYVAGLEQGLAA